MGQSSSSAEAVSGQSRKVKPTVTDAVFQDQYGTNGWARTTSGIVRSLENCALQKETEAPDVL